MNISIINEKCRKLCECYQPGGGKVKRERGGDRNFALPPVRPTPPAEMARSPDGSAREEIRRAELASIGTACESGGQRFSRRDARAVVCQSRCDEWLRSAGECAGRGGRSSGLD